MRDHQHVSYVSLGICAQLTRCFSAVAELLVIYLHSQSTFQFNIDVASELVDPWTGSVSDRDAVRQGWLNDRVIGVVNTL